MYGRAIRFTLKNKISNVIVVQQSNNNNNSIITLRCFPSILSSPVSTQPNYHKDRNLVDDIRESASGMPPASSSSSSDDHRVNVVKTSTTTPSSTAASSSSAYGGERGSFVGESVKQGVVKAVETGIEIGEMAKKTMDNVWEVTKDTSHKVKEAVAGDNEENYDVPPTDHFVDDLRKHADGYDWRRRNK